MKKRILTFLMVVLLALTGCDREPAETDPTATSQESITTAPGGSNVSRPGSLNETLRGLCSFNRVPPVPEEYLEYSCQYLPETVENPQNLPVLKWVFLGGNSKAVYNEEPVRELNRMLADRNMPFRIQFVCFSYYAATIPLGTEPYVDWFSREDCLAVLKEADLITGDLSQQKMTEYLMPITEYVAEDSPLTLKNAVPHERNWIKGTVDGEIYAINGATKYPFFGGWYVRTEFMEEMGLTEEDFQKNYWEMDELFAKIYEKNGNKPFLEMDQNQIVTGSAWKEDRLRSFLPGVLSMSCFELHHHVGGTYIIDSSSGTPKVEELLETEEFRNLRSAYMRYMEAGYGPAQWNVMNHERPDVSYGVIGGVTGGRFVDEYGNEMTLIQVTPSVYGDVYSNTGKSSGVAATSDHQVEAVTLLNLMAEDEDFRKQLLHGKEGRDYIVEEEKRKVITQEDGTIYNFSSISPFSSIRKSKSLSYLVYEGMTPLESYRYMLDHVDVVHMPVTVHYSGLEEEVKALEDLYYQYFGKITFPGKGKEGDLDYVPPFTDADYAQMLQ